VVRSNNKKKNSTGARAKTQRMIMRGINMSRGKLSKYQFALIAPFEEDAEGARVPDMGVLPTTAHHVKQDTTFTMISTTHIFVLLPSPTVSLLTNATTAAATTGYTAKDAAGNQIFGAVTGNNMANAYDTARVVAAGWKIRNNLNFSTVTGRVIVAPITFGKFQMGDAEMIATSISADQYLTLISNNTFSSLQALADFPGALEFQLDELIGNELVLTTRPCAPHGMDWRGTNQGTAVGTTYFTGENPAFLTVGGITNSSAVSTSQTGDVGGLVGWAVQILGVPASSVPILLNSVYHLEGQTGPSTLGTLVPSGVVRAEVNTRTAESQVSELARHPFAQILQAGAGALGKFAMENRESIARTAIRFGMRAITN